MIRRVSALVRSLFDTISLFAEAWRKGRDPWLRTMDEIEEEFSRHPPV